MKDECLILWIRHVAEYTWKISMTFITIYTICEKEKHNFTVICNYKTMQSPREADIKPQMPYNVVIVMFSLNISSNISLFIDPVYDVNFVSSCSVMSDIKRVT